jgi:branched-chain amino acid transport system substrate-binding protein
MRKYPVYLLAIIFVLTLGLSLSGCKNSSKKKDNDAIKIGAILPLTGSLANTGQENKIGIELALEEINKDDKILEVIYVDSKGDATNSVNSAKMLDTKGINKMILSTTATIIPILSMYKNNESMFFAANCMNPHVVDDYPNAIRVYMSVENETQVMADYSKSQNYQKIATLNINNDFGKEEIAQYIEKLEKQMDKPLSLKQETFEFSEKDIKLKLLKLKSFNPDILVICSFPDQWAGIISQLSEINYEGKILANSGFGLTAENDHFKTIPLMKQIYFAAPNYVIHKDKEEIKRIIDKVKREHNINANFNLLYFYDLMKILAQNVEFAEDNKIFIKEIIDKEYDGITGKIIFNQFGDIIPAETKLVNLIDGEYSIVSY